MLKHVVFVCVYDQSIMWNVVFFPFQHIWLRFLPVVCSLFPFDWIAHIRTRTHTRTRPRTHRAYCHITRRCNGACFQRLFTMEPYIAWWENTSLAKSTHLQCVLYLANGCCTSRSFLAWKSYMSSVRTNVSDGKILQSGFRPLFLYCHYQFSTSFFAKEYSLCTVTEDRKQNMIDFTAVFAINSFYGYIMFTAI